MESPRTVSPFYRAILAEYAGNWAVVKQPRGVHTVERLSESNVRQVVSVFTHSDGRFGCVPKSDQTCFEHATQVATVCNSVHELESEPTVGGDL